jgi:hypothetical protein
MFRLRVGVLKLAYLHNFTSELYTEVFTYNYSVITFFKGGSLKSSDSNYTNISLSGYSSLFYAPNTTATLNLIRVKLSGFTSTAVSGAFINAPNSSVSDIFIIWNFVTVESCSATSVIKGGLIYVANSNLNITIRNSVISGISVRFDVIFLKNFFIMKFVVQYVKVGLFSFKVVMDFI